MTSRDYRNYIENAIHNEEELRAAYNKLFNLYKNFNFPYEPEIAVQLKKEIRAYNRK